MSIFEKRIIDLALTMRNLLMPAMACSTRMRVRDSSLFLQASSLYLLASFSVE